MVLDIEIDYDNLIWALYKKYLYFFDFVLGQKFVKFCIPPLET